MAESHGRFVWYELTTTDTAATRAFYTEVVGWGARNASMAGLPYTVFTAWDDPVSGMMELPKAARNRGERPMWIGYVYVDDVDAVADRVERLGGAVHLPPQDVLHVSRFSVVSDPQMAIFALFKWQHAGHARSVNRLSLGCVGWHELLAADYEKAWDFYSELFGWQKTRTNVSSVGLYQQFSIAGETIGGMMTKPPMVPTSCWLYYFNVGDIDAAIKRVTAAGGQLLGGPMEVPDANWIAQCVDPQGAIFALAGRRGFGYFKRADVHQPDLTARQPGEVHGHPPRLVPG
jgi:predicted enzyme related to lactoylglutathione lyase